MVLVNSGDFKVLHAAVANYSKSMSFKRVIVNTIYVPRNDSLCLGQNYSQPYSPLW